MFELNEQELEQVAGGHGYGSHSTAAGGASADFGVAASSSYASSKVTPCYAKSSSVNESLAIGCNVSAGSSAATAAGAGN